MKNKVFCQSCSMPLDSDAVCGTEKDGSKNHEYCKYCYQDGTFINPSMTLDEMKELVKTQMEKMKMDSGLISLAVNSLPQLKRWKKEKSMA
ncbi:MAG: zinc ribbon domain-containing protein [Chitinophagaceae bacterium]|nr:zinc ribbon domain-containing protein [Chitinophagaceae bacterium]